MSIVNRILVLFDLSLPVMTLEEANKIVVAYDAASREFNLKHEKSYHTFSMYVSEELEDQYILARNIIRCNERDSLRVESTELFQENLRNL